MQNLPIVTFAGADITDGSMGYQPQWHYNTGEKNSGVDGPWRIQPYNPNVHS